VVFWGYLSAENEFFQKQISITLALIPREKEEGYLLQLLTGEKTGQCGALQI